MKRILTIFLLIFSTLILIACTDDANTLTFEVIFDSNGGTEVESQTVVSGETATEPTNPTKSEYIFGYWYVSDSEVSYDFNTPVLADLTLYAFWEDIPENVYSVAFNSDGGSAVADQLVVEGGFASIPAAPTKAGFEFVHWYLTDPNTPFSFATAITQNVTLTAKWGEAVPEISAQEKIAADLAAIQEAFVVSKYQRYMPARGPVYNTNISWTKTSKYISNSGIILPVLATEEEHTATLTARFTVTGAPGVSVEQDFFVELKHADPVEIAETRTVPFTNVTTEYNVEDSELALYFEDGGSVPYVKVVDFFELLAGFIDPQYEMNYVKTGTSLTIEYRYYDEEADLSDDDFDGWYDLSIVIDSEENTLFTPDPGFYWGYVVSTATNFGRHIGYDRNNEGAVYEEGHDLIYDLGLYGMDIVVYEDEVLVPYYIANQLFAGSSYYNVYYNYDGLYGIYSLPSSGTDEYTAIRNSSKNNTAVPVDLLVHTFNFLAFSLDYFYGLQEIMEVDTYYDLLFAAKEQMLRTAANQLDVAIGDFLVKTLDEPHTSYGYPGYYNRATYGGPSYGSLLNYGPRFVSWYNQGLIATDAQIGVKWNVPSTWSGWNVTHPDRPNFWFLDDAKTSVVLSLDRFATSDIEEDDTWNNAYFNHIFDVDESVEIVPALLGASKYFFYNRSTNESKIAHVLMKYITVNDSELVREALESAGYVLNETSNQYDKTIGDVQYTIQFIYNSFYESLVLAVQQVKADDDYPQLSAVVFNVITADTAVYMEYMMDKILEESPALENIILDVTWNTGGNVGALYRVVGFITDEPFRVSRINGDTGSKSSSFVVIDGVPNYKHLNWALLTTPTTFSAANSLAIIFKDNGLGPIIGIKTGGGASSITPILLPNGTAFTMSSNSISAYLTGDGTEGNPYIFHSSEFGISPTYPIGIIDIYNNEILMDLLAQYYAN